MVKKKSTRTKGKIKLSEYFKELKKGDAVAIVKDLSIQASFPKRLQGKTGVVESERGKVCVVKIQDQDKEKKFLIEPIHLKKIKQNKD